MKGIFIMLIFLLALAGCSSSSTGRATDAVAERDPDVEIHARLIDKFGDGVVNPYLTNEGQFYFSVLGSLVTSAGYYYKVTHGFPEHYDYDDLVESGAIILIPRNLYAGEDAAQTETYSQGDLFFEYNTNEGQTFTLHLGKGAPEYWPEKFAQGETIRETHRGKEKIYDGRSKSTYLRPPTPEEIIQAREDIDETSFWMTHPEANQMNNMHSQIQNFLASHSFYYDTPPDNFDDLIERFGRKNPKAWQNPYTGNPMEELPPKQANDLNADAILIKYYAGNYSYELQHYSWGQAAFITFYYLDENDKIKLFSCSGTDRETSISGN